jgi:glucose/arabinose dehydrogenase
VKRAVLLIVVALAACSSSASPSRPTATPGAEPTVVVDGLRGPTQFVDGPNDSLIVAELNGEEAAATGRVVMVDLASGARTELLAGLDKPTGVAWFDDRLWVMLRNSLISAPWTGTGQPGPTTVVVDGLASNGRSEGTLTPLPDGQLLFTTTGSAGSGEPDEGSGIVWRLDPATDDAEPVAIGLKNAYAHVVLDDGAVAVTEIGDNIADAPVEEINVIDRLDPTNPVDFGWPACPGDIECAGVASPLATFPRNATPTGVTVVGGDLYVTLFVTGELVRVNRATGATTTALTGLDTPHTVIARPDGQLWISEHNAGRIIAMRPKASS